MAKSAYEALGVSATKEDVHAAVANIDAGLYPGAFCRVGPDVLGDDPEWCAAIHSDDAGTKVLVAYLIYRETGNAKVFRGVAQDALVMNLDDLLCIGATDRFLLSNTINRNSFYIPGAVIGEVIAGYDDCIRTLKPHGINIVATGGETADMVDVVRTILVGATVATRLKRDCVINNDNIVPNDVIIGLSSTGQSIYEDHPNSGIGDNGLTLARHALLHKDYGKKYPEASAPEVSSDLTYRGPFRLQDAPAGLGMNIGDALRSPTRTYAPIVRELLEVLGSAVHGIVHNTGGGLTKCSRFGTGVHFVKDNLFPVPPLFHLIAEHGKVDWREMYQTFNMGHRLEVFLSAQHADKVVAISKKFGVDAQIVGRCESGIPGQVTLMADQGTFVYEPQ